MFTLDCGLYYFYIKLFLGLYFIMIENLLLLCFASVYVTFGAEQDLARVHFRHQARQQLPVAIGVRLLPAVAIVMVVAVVVFMASRSFLRSRSRCIVVASAGCVRRIQIGLGDFEKVFHSVSMI